MRPTLVDDINDVLDKVKTCQTLDDLKVQTEQAISLLDCKYYIVALVPTYYEIDPAFPYPIHITNYPDGWMEYYLEQRFDIHDVSLHHSLKGLTNPVIWNRTFTLNSLTAPQQQIYHEAGDLGIRQGVTIPTLSVPGVVGAGGVVYECGDHQIESYLENRLDLISRLMYAVSDEIIYKFLPQFHNYYPSPLSADEKEILFWKSHGLMMKHIDEKVQHLSARTIERYVQSIKQKLKARTLEHAVAIAIRWGLLR